MHDSGVEDRLRQTFRAETDGLGLTITAAELERRLRARRGNRYGRRLSLIAAGIAIVAVGAIGAMSNGWLHLPATGTAVGPSGSPSPSASGAPFAPPMLVSVSTSGQPGETVSVASGCWLPFAMTDAVTGTGGCAAPAADAACCEPLDVPYGSDLTFTVRNGWSIERTEIGIVGQSWVDDRAAASRTITGWTSTGDQALRIDAVLSKDGATFSTTFGVAVHGSATEPAIADPVTACRAADPAAATPPGAQLIVGGTQAIAGLLGSTEWNGRSVDTGGDPMPTTWTVLPVGSSLVLRIDGGVCANAWRIEYGPPITGPWTSINRSGSLVLPHHVPNGGAGVGAVANRFDLASLPPGDWYIEAELRYVGGTAHLGWHVIVK